MTLVRSAELYDFNQYQITPEQWQNIRDKSEISLIASNSGIVKGKLMLTVESDRENLIQLSHNDNTTLFKINNNANHKIIPLSNDAFQKIKNWPNLRIMFEPEIIVIMPLSKASDFFDTIAIDVKLSCKTRHIIDSIQPSVGYITPSELMRIRHHKFELIQQQTGIMPDGQFLFKISISSKTTEAKIMFDMIGDSTATLNRRCTRSLDNRYLTVAMSSHQYKTIQHLPFLGIYDEGKWVVEIEPNTIEQFMKQLRQQ